MNVFCLILIVAFLQNSEILYASRENASLIFDAELKKDEGQYDLIRRGFQAMNAFKLMVQQDKLDRPEIKNELELLEYKYRQIFVPIRAFSYEFDLFLKNSNRNHHLSQYALFERLFFRCCRNQTEIIQEYRRICARINIADLD